MSVRCIVHSKKLGDEGRERAGRSPDRSPFGFHGFLSCALSVSPKTDTICSHFPDNHALSHRTEPPDGQPTRPVRLSKGQCGHDPGILASWQGHAWTQQYPPRLSWNIPPLPAPSESRGISFADWELVWGRPTKTDRRVARRGTPERKGLGAV
ncbi:hypothetical protein LX32DRAFT_373448 [Colletotrichum zoysiae]|uniref:Uncharacterized protein n=1 Tax=Colletotrichum zoysiae TaxID=1216348 RepID=A0AAD9M958_9PEZI|nr:hypothetical protein LX32DRAFT_373448 [Colletotrichum zoysiae]